MLIYWYLLFAGTCYKLHVCFASRGYMLLLVAFNILPRLWPCCYHSFNSGEISVKSSVIYSWRFTFGRSFDFGVIIPAKWLVDIKVDSFGAPCLILQFGFRHIEKLISQTRLTDTNAVLTLCKKIFRSIIRKTKSDFLVWWGQPFSFQRPKQS